MNDVLCSPSFLAEFLTRLTVSGNITVTTHDALMVAKLTQLATQLALADKVQIRPSVAASR